MLFEYSVYIRNDKDHPLCARIQDSVLRQQLVRLRANEISKQTGKAVQFDFLFTEENEDFTKG